MDTCAESTNEVKQLMYEYSVFVSKDSWIRMETLNRGQSNTIARFFDTRKALALSYQNAHDNKIILTSNVCWYFY